MPQRGHRKPDHDRRHHQVKTRLTDAERCQLARAAKLTGLTTAEYLRQRALGHRPRARRDPTTDRLVRALNAIGNNLNQLAHRANAGDFPTERDIQHTLARLVRALRKVA